MPNRLASLVAASGLALAGAPALAQSAPTTVAPVIVQGAAAAPAAVVQQRSYHFVQKNVAVGNPELEQIVRWRDPVCVKVSGLIPNQDEAIAARIANVARAVDLRIGKPGCRPNIEIVFTDKPQAVMDQVYKRREYMLGYYHRHDGVRLKTVTRPIQAWHVTATLGGGGAIGLIEGPAHSEVVDDPENQTPPGCGDSRFSSCLQGVFKNVFVIVDNKFLGSNSLETVTDYLVMVALAEPNSLEGCNELPSVVDLFAKADCPGREAPDGLTPADASFLTALYAANAEQKRWVEESDITERMARILIRANVVSK